MKNKFTLDTTSVPFSTHASCMIHPVKTKTMDVTQWQDKWSHTWSLCAPAAEARRASLACELQNSQWNVRVGGGAEGTGWEWRCMGQYQAPATEKSTLRPVFGTISSVISTYHKQIIIIIVLRFNNSIISAGNAVVWKHSLSFCCLLPSLSQIVRKLVSSFTEVLWKLLFNRNN